MPALKPPVTTLLGLGLMGAAIAGRMLGEGAALTVWNRSPDKAAPLGRMGAQVCNTSQDAVSRAEIICICLTDAPAVEAVLFGENGAAKHIRSGSVIVDFSTIGVEETRAFAGRMAAAGVHWIDAPVSGGVQAASAGGLIVLAGGEREHLETLRPVLDLVSNQVTHLGPVGAGQAAKLCNQLIVSASLVAIAESMALGSSLGVDVARLPRALAGGFADSRPLQIFGPRMAGASLEPKLGAIATMAKDVDMILRAAGPDLDLPLLRQSAGVYARAKALGLGDEDLGALRRLYDEAEPRPVESHGN